MTSLADAAIRYADSGYRVFPLHGIDQNGTCSCGRACDSPGKHPRINRWQEEATDDQDIVDFWWDKWPDANIGIATGRGSGVWVLDVDNKQSVALPGGGLTGAGNVSLDDAQHNHDALPGTRVCETGGGGQHLYFLAVEGQEIRNRAAILPSIDVRGDGGYVVAPPSTHASGNRYQWVDEGAEVAEAPAWLVDVALHGQRSETPTNGDDTLLVVAGGRNDYLFRHGASLRGLGLGDLDILGALLARNVNRCVPPLADEEVRGIARSIGSYDVGKPARIDFGRGGSVPAGSGLPELPEGFDLATSLFDLLGESFPPLNPLVEGMIDDESRTILAGMGNLGKSWLVYDLCLAVATGGKWLGHQTQQGTVLLVDEESGRRWVQDRFIKLINGREMGSTRDIPLYSSVEKRIKMDSGIGSTIIKRMMERYRPKLIVLDSLTRVHSRDENSNQEMAMFFEEAGRLMRTYQCGMIFTHHTRKPAAGDGMLGNSLRGAGDIRNVMDTVFIATPGPEKNQLVLHHDKQRNMHKVDPVLVEVRFSDFDEAVHVVNLGTPPEPVHAKR